MKKFLLLVPVIFLIGIFLQSCQEGNFVDPQTNVRQLNLESISGPDVEPVLYTSWSPAGGASNECTYAGSTCDYAYKWNEDPEGVDELPPLGYPSEGAPNGTITTPEGNEITIINSDGKTFDWTSEWPVCKVIVKAGTAALVYSYEGGAFGDDGLYAPESKDISHITFCFSEGDNEECYQCETAMAGNLVIPTKGAWFAYYIKNSGSQIIWAGKTENAGTVTIVNGYMTINLTGGWMLQENVMVNCEVVLGEDGKPIPYTEPVKVQGTSDMPMSKGSPGLYTPYKGTGIENVNVGIHNFYLIHLDLIKVVECPE